MAEVMPLRLLKHLVLIAWCLLVAVKAEIRCYCNQPTCVSTGYMCKSQSSMCFTELFSYSSDPFKSRQGCVELLSSEKKDKCKMLRTDVTTFPAVLCCQEDMCNYMNTVEFPFHVNESASRDAYDIEEEHRHEYHPDYQQDVWFKAAVIAVPIAGGFILILLILQASRILRQDSKWQGQLLELRRQQQQFVVKSTGQDSKYSHVYQNVMPSMCNEHRCLENQYVTMNSKPINNRNSMCAMLLPWTKWKPPNTLSHV